MSPPQDLTILAGVPFFDNVDGCTSDHCCHNTLEGTTKLETQFSHRHFFHESTKTNPKYKHRLTGETWNNLLATVDVVDAHGDKRPDMQPEKAFKPDGSLYWAASQTKVYAPMSIALIEPFIDTRDPVWQYWLKHCYMLKLLFLEKFSQQNLIQLHHAALDHLKAFTELYPGQELVKHHWLMHVLRDILLNGPSIQSSCIKLEMTHQYFKQLINSRAVKRESRHTHRTLMTMATRYCRLKALKLSAPGGRMEVGHSCGRATTIILPQDSSLFELIMDSGFAHLALMAGATAPITCTFHSAYKSGRSTIKEGRMLACLLGEEIVYGQVTSIISALGSDLIVYNRFTNSKVMPGGDVQVSSLSTTEEIIEFGTQGLTFARNSVLNNEIEGYTIVI